MSTANEIQWRNIKKVVRAAADLSFGGKDDPKYGHCWLAVVNSLTASDGIDVTALGLEPLPLPTLDTAQPEPVNAMLVEALERSFTEIQHVLGSTLELPFQRKSLETVLELLRTALTAAQQAQPVQVNAMLVEALEEADDYLADCDIPSTRTIRVKIDAALTAAQQAQPERAPLSDADCTRIYNEANGITDKNPPISTQRIFAAMRAAIAKATGGQHD